MIKSLSAVVLFFLLMPVHLSLAQASGDSVKIYSGYLHQSKNKSSFFLDKTDPLFSQPDKVFDDSECAIEFKSPVPFLSQPVLELPEKLSYSVSFKNGTFKKFIIKIYTDDDDYTIDPNAEDKQISITADHYIVDSYLAYLILGSKIDHIEVIGVPGNGQYKYVLDKFEIHNHK